jgi:hypothetical protein
MVEGMWICSRCARRAESGAECARCRTDSMYDLRSQRMRELLSERQDRLVHERDARVNKLCALAGVVIVVLAAKFVPGYWKLRGDIYPGLPFFIDQLLLMAGVGLVARFAIDRIMPQPPFGFVAKLPPTDQA